MVVVIQQLWQLPTACCSFSTIIYSINPLDIITVMVVHCRCQLCVAGYVHTCPV